MKSEVTWADGEASTRQWKTRLGFEDEVLVPNRLVLEKEEAYLMRPGITKAASRSYLEPVWLKHGA